MTERLTVQQVVELNQLACGDTGETSAVLDAGELEAAVERPWSGFADFEAFPDLFTKAAALLHGICARQVFENGNKRTAWYAAVTFLELNGVDLGTTETVEADMFVRAAALDHSLEIEDLAEWLIVAHARTREPSLDAPRFSIESVGQFIVDPDAGVVTADGWTFGAPEEIDIEIQLVDVDGTYAGWSIADLHVVLHGRPCRYGATCPVSVFVG